MYVRILIICVSVCFSFSVSADQNDPRLNQLFTGLKQVTELSKGEALTQEIWKVWYEVGHTDTQGLFDQGVSAMGAAKLKEALEIFNEVTELHPDFAEGWNRRATLFFLMGEFALSIQDIKQTLVLEPRHFGAISGLGQIYLRQNKLLDARAAFSRALEINPHLVNARLNIDRINQILSKNSV